MNELDYEEWDEAKLPMLNERQKNAYRQLTELCVHNTVHKKKIFEFIETLKDYETETVYQFVYFLTDSSMKFIMRLDFKEAIEELDWQLKNTLKDNYSFNIELPKVEDYDEELTVSAPGVFGDYDQALKKTGLQLGFIDTDSDEYFFVVHKINDKEKVKYVINTMGYKYKEVFELY